MNLLEYLKDRTLVYLGRILCMLLLSFYLLSVGNRLDNVILILIFWLALMAVCETGRFLQRKKTFECILQTLSELDKPYLIGEVESPLNNLEGKKYWEILRKSNKSVIEKINETEDEMKDYREYIESRVHEIKLPITALELMVQKEEPKKKNSLMEELERIDNYVEQVLFYARSEQVYQDFVISETDITEVIYEVMVKNKGLLIGNRAAVQVETEGNLLLCDGKWMSFILQQVITNAVKYMDFQKEIFRIHIYIKKDADKKELVVEDNGVGISPGDIGRVFEKGFTGANGRAADKNSLMASTGMGLYLCRKLCEKMDIGIRIESEEGEYTKVIFCFGKSTYLTKL